MVRFVITLKYFRLFGLGEQTGIDLAGEVDGFLPSKEWKEKVKGERWYIGDTYHLAIGQGDLLVTPLQVANFTSVFNVSSGVSYFFPPALQIALSLYFSLKMFAAKLLIFSS